MQPPPPAHPAASIDAAFDLLADEPDLAVVRVDTRRRILATNAAARRIYLPATSRGEALPGRLLAELHPRPFDREVERLVALLATRGQPLLVRGIWRGRGVRTSVHAVAGGGFLLLGRRSAPREADADDATHHRVDAEVLDLGELSELTPRELEVLAILGTGGTLKDAAAGLARSVKTIESHRDNIARKLGLSRRGELVRVVERSGLRPSDARLTRLVRKTEKEFRSATPSGGSGV